MEKSPEKQTYRYKLMLVQVMSGRNHVLVKGALFLSVGVIDTTILFVKKAHVDGGASQKRFRPAPMGRAHRYRRRTSHITIVVDEK